MNMMIKMDPKFVKCCEESPTPQSITYIKIRKKKECRNEGHNCKVWSILWP